MSIKDRRVALGMTQPEVCARLREIDPRMDVPMYSKIENGQCLPTPRVLEALESILQAPRSELLSADELDIMEAVEACTPQLSADTMRVVSAIPCGREHAASRLMLANRLQMSDRKIRAHIEAARRAGIFILNLPDSAGYYRSDNLDEIETQYRIDHARALSVLSRLTPMRRALKNAGRDVK